MNVLVHSEQDGHDTLTDTGYTERTFWCILNKMDMTLLLIQDKQNEHSEKDGHDTFTDARYTLDEHSGAF